MKKASYDWDRWLKKRRFDLQRGVDYRCGTASMIQQIRNKATSLGLRVSIEEVDNGIRVSVQRSNHVLSRN